MPSVMCFGDSNTHGSLALPELGASGRFPKLERWPNVMAAQLGSEFEVVAEGHPGRTAALDDPVEGVHKNGRRVLQALLETHKPLDLLIIMLGTNDLKARFDLPPIDIALSIGNLAVLAQSLPVWSEAGPRCLFLAPVPIEETGCIAEMFAGGALKSRALPRYLEEAAYRHGADYLDLGAVATVDPVDGVHLSKAAHAAIGHAVADKVRSIFQSA